MDTSYKQQNNPTPVSTFETIDMALYTWLNETLDIHTLTNDGIKKVPVTWFSRERAFQIKNDKDERDNNGFLDFPKIQLQRTNVSLTSATERPMPGLFLSSRDYKNNQFGFWTKINQGKTRNFANAYSNKRFKQKNFKFNNGEIVNEYVFTPYPSYYDVKYEISIRALYMQQINDIVAPFQRSIIPYNTGVFTIKYNGFKYEVFMDKDVAFTTNSPEIAENEKVYEAKISIKVLGFTTTSQSTQTTPNIVKREGPAKIRIQRERVIVGDINDLGDSDTPFRE